MRKKTVRKKVKKNPPKHFVGALIGAATNVATGIIGAQKEKKAAIEDANNRYATAHASNLEADKLALEEYPEEGLGEIDYYQAKGGKLAKPAYATKGGDLETLSSDSDEVVGNKHNETTIDNTSGVKLNNGREDIAEVEDGEVIKNNIQVYSDQTLADGKNTYAEVAKRIATKKGKLEEEIMDKDKIGMKTNRRKIKALDKEEDRLFIKQEAEKGNDVTSKLSKGGDIAKAAIPFVDNIANAFITANTPKVAKPTMLKHRKLETDVNVQPQLTAVTDAVDASSKFIKDNSSSSASARSGIAATRLAGAKQVGSIKATEENAERAARNANVENLSKIDAINASKTDAYAQQQVARRDAVQQRTSANFANMADDFIDNRNFAAAEDFNKERLDVAREIGDVKGTSLRVDLNNPTEIAKLQSDKAYAQEQLTRYANNPNELAKLKIILGIQ